MVYITRISGIIELFLLFQILDFSCGLSGMSCDAKSLWNTCQVQDRSREVPVQFLGRTGIPVTWSLQILCPVILLHAREVVFPMVLFRSSPQVGPLKKDWLYLGWGTWGDFTLTCYKSCVTCVACHNIQTVDRKVINHLNRQTSNHWSNTKPQDYQVFTFIWIIYTYCAM